MKERFGYGLIVVATIVAFAMTRNNLKDNATEPGTVTIRVAHFTLDPQFRVFLTKAARAYEKRHPHVQIRPMDVPRQVYLQWQRTQIVGEMAPEIMQFAYFNPGVEDMVMHHFTVLDPWVEKPNPYRTEAGADLMPWRDTFIDGLNSRDAYNEKLRAYFGIPMIVGGYRFYFNKSMSEERLGGQQEWTYREFLPLMDMLNDSADTSGESHQVMPVASSNFSSYAWFKMLFSSVTQSLQFSLDRNYDFQLSGRDAALGFLEGRWNYHTEEMQAALKLMREASFLMNPGFSQLQKPDGIMEFAQQRSLGVAGGHVDLTYLKEVASFEIGDASFPVPDKADPVYGKYVRGPLLELAIGSSLTLGVMRSPVQEQAIDFLQFLTGTEMMAMLHAETGWRVAADPEFDAAKSKLKLGYPTNLYDSMNGRGNNMTYLQNSYRLYERNGGVEAFADLMDAESSTEFVGWIGSQTTTLRQTLRQQEMAIMANWALAQARGNASSEDSLVAEFLQVNNRQEAEYRSILRFMKSHDESL